VLIGLKREWFGVQNQPGHKPATPRQAGKARVKKEMVRV
jgi:hypothetical protein